MLHIFIPLGFSLIFALVMIWAHYQDTVVSKRNRLLEELNKLYECTNCKKYHREHQQELKEKSDDTYKKVKNNELYLSGDGELKSTKDDDMTSRLTRSLLFNDGVCPHCYSNKVHSYNNEEYDWMKYHNDCTALTKKTIKTYKQGLEEVERLAYEMRSTEKFMEYNKLIK
jgi:hypothetical protein